MGLISPPAFYVVTAAVAKSTNRPWYLGNSQGVPIKASVTRA